jgi:hypothetical protein
MLLQIIKALFVHSIRCRTMAYRVNGTQETLHRDRGFLLATCGKCRSTLTVPIKKGVSNVSERV